MSGSGEKVCTTCSATKSASEFHKNCATRDNLHTTCKACRCMYASYTTDLEYKRVRARQRYAFTRCHEKAKRIALRLLGAMEAAMGGEQQQHSEHQKQPARDVLEEYVPAETVAAIARMLEAHLGPNTYWSGFGQKWTIICLQRPAVTTWAHKENLASFVRQLLAPDNLHFESL